MPPLGCVQKEGGRWKIEEWLEQIMSEKDQEEKVRIAEHAKNLVTTVRSSSEEKEATVSRRSTKQRDRRGKGEG